jgi:hypothetical protein
MSITTELQRIHQAKTDLKTAIEGYTNYPIDDEATLDTYVSMVDEVFNRGWDSGYEHGYGEGKAEGGSDSWYDTFWDNALNYGGLISGDYLFAGGCWTDETFIPKYDVNPTTAQYMFQSSKVTDVVSALEKAGKTIDFSNCTNFQFLVYGSSVTHIGIVDMTKVSSSANANSVFRGGGGHSLQKIDKVIVSEKYPLGSNAFTNCTKLTDIDIEGTITGSFSVINSPKLTVQSAKNIITHLANYAGADKEFTQSVNFHANVWDLLDAEGATSPNENTWREYVNDLGWNVG